MRDLDPIRRAIARMELERGTKNRRKHRRYKSIDV